MNSVIIIFLMLHAYFLLWSWPDPRPGAPNRRRERWNDIGGTLSTLNTVDVDTPMQNYPTNDITNGLSLLLYGSHIFVLWHIVAIDSQSSSQVGCHVHAGVLSNCPPSLHNTSCQWKSAEQPSQIYCRILSSCHRFGPQRYYYYWDSWRWCAPNTVVNGPA